LEIRMKRALPDPRQRLPGAPELLALLLIPLLAAMAPAGRADDTGRTNSCEACHGDPDFLVTNKKLYDYYQEWSGSIHDQEEVTCDDCHGGNAGAAAKQAAHADGVGASDPASGIYFRNVPDTCGACHEEILAGFSESNHYEHVEKKKGEDQGPTCVTCHGAIDSEVLDVNTVTAACARCHNEKSGNHPEHPERAHQILNRFLSIQRFYRYITIRAEPDEAKAFFGKIDPKMKQLSVTWHTFDLEEIDKKTAEVLDSMKTKRDEIRSRRKNTK
jgi:hypothetical protein